MKTSYKILFALYATLTVLLVAQSFDNQKRYEDILQNHKQVILGLRNDIEYLVHQNEELRREIEDTGIWIDDLNDKIRFIFDELDRKIDLPDKTNRGSVRWEKRTMHCTAYWEGSCGKEPDDPAYGITASGERVREWYTIAAGPELKMGTKVYIPFFRDQPNGGIFVKTDTGGAIDNGDLDIYLSGAAACFEFGVRDLPVYILAE